MAKYIPESVLVKIKATHFNFVNRNSVYYTTDAVNRGAKSWTAPYKRPQLVAHDKSSDPIGRIVDYQIKQTDAFEEPPDYLELTAKVTDAAAVEKILDGRYCTVSVGSRTNKVICSECSQNIVEDGLCEHKKGSYNEKGDRIHWIIDQIEYIEDSFVNEPADPYARVDQIDVGTGWIAYQEFLDQRDSILSEIQMEDALMPSDAKLTSKARKSLPDSAFCYVVGEGENKVRKFPAHDAAHVRNGLARLNQASVSSSAKKKILACLKRRAKRYGIKVSEDTVGTNQEYLEFLNSIDPTFGMDEAWTEEEIKSIDELFAQEPNFDAIEEETSTEETQEDETQEQDPAKMKKDELVDAFSALKKAHDEAVSTKDATIETLRNRNSELETILTDREDEVAKFLDSNAALEKNYRDAVVANIIDLKKPDNKEETDALVEKLGTRKIESLIDTLSDLRNENTETDSTDSTESEDRVEDPTQQDNSDSQETQNTDEKTTDPWAVFSQDNRTSEVE